MAQETNNQRPTYLTSILQLPRKTNYNMVDKGREDYKVGLNNIEEENQEISMNLIILHYIQ